MASLLAENLVEMKAQLTAVLLAEITAVEKVDLTVVKMEA